MLSWHMIGVSSADRNSQRSRQHHVSITDNRASVIVYKNKAVCEVLHYFAFISDALFRTKVVRNYNTTGMTY